MVLNRSSPLNSLLLLPCLNFLVLASQTILTVLYHLSYHILQIKLIAFEFSFCIEFLILFIFHFGTLYSASLACYCCPPLRSKRKNLCNYVSSPKSPNMKLVFTTPRLHLNSYCKSPKLCSNIPRYLLIHLNFNMYSFVCIPPEFQG